MLGCAKRIKKNQNYVEEERKVVMHVLVEYLL